MFLNVLSWNVHGLSAKLYDVEFLNFIRSKDIIALYETWIVNYDTVLQKFVNFNHFFVPATEYPGPGRPSGGILVLVAKHFSKYMSCVKKSDLAVYIKIDKDFLHIPNDMI